MNKIKVDQLAVDSSRSKIGSFGDLSAINSDQGLAGKSTPKAMMQNLPNKLKINFDSSAKKPGLQVFSQRARDGMISSEMNIKDDGAMSLRVNPYMQDLVRPYDHRTQQKSNLRIQLTNANREANRTSEVGVNKNAPEVTVQRPKKFQVRKLLKFRGGVMVPTSPTEQQAVEAGKNMCLSEENNTSSQSPRRVALRASKSGQGNRSPTRVGGKGNVVATSGFALQNKLVSKSHHRGGKTRNVGNYQSLLYKLTQPKNTEDLVEQSDTFFKEDLFVSPKFRDEEHDTMKVRFEDKAKVVSRSICGTRGTFQAYLSDRQKEKAQEAKRRKMIAVMNKRSTFEISSSNHNKSSSRLGGPTTRSSVSVFGAFARNESRKSFLSNKMLIENYEQGLGAGDSQLIKETGSNQEHDSEDSTISGKSQRVKKQDGITGKQMRALDKLTLYQKGWQRMNKLVKKSADGSKRPRGTSLIEQQEKFQPKKDDALSSFYDSTQRSVSQCPNEKKRSLLIQRACLEENQKFDCERSRKSWVGGLRSENYMYLQTTRNVENALYCRVSVSSQGQDPAYRSTYGALCQSQMGSVENSTSMMERGRNSLPNKLAMTHNLMSPTADMIAPQRVEIVEAVNPQAFLESKPSTLRKKTTQIFDGAIIDACKNMRPRNTYQSKSYSSARSKRAGTYLPEVAVALKQHERTRDLMERQREEQEAVEMGFEAK